MPSHPSSTSPTMPESSLLRRSDPRSPLFRFLLFQKFRSRRPAESLGPAHTCFRSGLRLTSLAQPSQGRPLLLLSQLGLPSPPSPPSAPPRRSLPAPESTLLAFPVLLQQRVTSPLRPLSSVKRFLSLGLLLLLHQWKSRPRPNKKPNRPELPSVPVAHPSTTTPPSRLLKSPLRSPALASKLQ